VGLGGPRQGWKKSKGLSVLRRQIIEDFSSNNILSLQLSGRSRNWEGDGNQPENQVVVLDEAHNIEDVQTTRTQ